MNFTTGEVIELKPNNPRAIRRGERILALYIEELQATYPHLEWTGRVQTYDR